MIDLEAIRKKVQQLQGARSSSNVQFWKVDPRPEPYEIRVIPWPEEMLSEGTPFVERHFYYIGENRGILAPEQFGKEDPIANLRIKLYKTGNPADREVAKKLRSKMRCYLPIIERGKENEGIKVWSFGKAVYQRLLNFFLNPEVGDWTDVKEGRDLKVTIIQQEGKRFRDTHVDLAFSQSPLLNDDDKIKELLEKIPNMDDVYKQKSTEEVEKVLNDWLNGDETSEGDGSSRNDGGSDALDDLVREVKGATTDVKKEEKSTKTKAAAAKKPAEKPRRKTSKKKDDDGLDDLAGDDNPAKSLDAAFDELMDSDND